MRAVIEILVIKEPTTFLPYEAHFKEIRNLHSYVRFYMCKSCSEKW